MSVITKIPLFFYILIVYNLIAFGADTGFLLNDGFISWQMMSGATLHLNNGHFLLVLGVLALYFEIFKSTRSTISSMIEQSISMILFIVFLGEFLLVKQAGTATFLLLTLMQLMDVMSGVMVSISSARRDISIGE